MRSLWRRIYFLLKRRRNAAELEEEIRLHVELRAERLEARGIPPAKASREARKRFGNRTVIREAAGEVWAFTSLEQMWLDVRFAGRALRNHPAFTLAAVVSLALGIGVNTAVFSLVDTLVFRPLQVRDPGELVRIGSRENNGMTLPLPGPVLDNLRKDPLLHGVCGFTAGDAAIEYENHSVVAPALSLTGDCYETLGVRPALGRLLTAADDHFGAPKVAVIGYGFWQAKLAANPGVLESTIKIGGDSFRIVGVTEKRFEGLLWGYPMSVSAPISQRNAKSAQDPTGHFYWAETLGRLREGVQEQHLEADLRTKWRRVLEAGLPAGFNGSNRTELVSMPPVVSSGATGIDYYFRDHFQIALFTLLGVSILVLLVSCTNVANLLLARGIDRQHEIGLRLAIGAARGRIVRQLLVESSLLLAGSLGLACVLAMVGARTIAGFFLSAFARPDVAFRVEIDWRVLVFTGATAIVAVLVFAIVPAWRSSDIDPATALRSSSRTVSGSRASTRKTLLAGQVALTLVILVGANVFAESMAYLRENALTFTGDNVLNAQLMPVPHIGSIGNKSGSYVATLLDQVRALRGLRRVSLSSFTPLLSTPYKEDVKRLDGAGGIGLQAPAEFVTDDFLAIMHIPLLEGRDFTRTETERSQRTAIVSQFAARRLFPEGHAIGRHIQFGTEPETRDVEIIGIAADRQLEDPHRREQGFILLNLWQLQRMADWGNLQVDATGPLKSVELGVRKAIEHDRRQQIFSLRTLSGLREQSLLQDRLLAAIGEVYVALVLVLAVLGLMGLLLFFVSSREKEIGIRLALGASKKNVRWLVAREAALVTGIGMLFGLPASYVLIHSVAALVYGVPPALIGPAVNAFVILGLAAALAMVIPMYRASAINPNVALKDS